MTAGRLWTRTKKYHVCELPFLASTAFDKPGSEEPEVILRIARNEAGSILAQSFNFAAVLVDRL